MTNQEAFTRMVTHLRHQGRKSVHPKLPHQLQMFAYRAPTGERCPVGVLITDEFYTPALEGYTITTPFVQHMLDEALPGVSFDLLWVMQCIHDMDPPTAWESSWTKVARDVRWSLKMPPIVVDALTVSTVEEVTSALA